MDSSSTQRLESAEKRVRFTFTGGSNVTLRGSLDTKWGWVDAHGQAVGYSRIPEFLHPMPYLLKWWDVDQQTNRPHGWAFSKINNGVIRDMKIWKASSILSLLI